MRFHVSGAKLLRKAQPGEQNLISAHILAFLVNPTERQGEGAEDNDKEPVNLVLGAANTVT